MNVALALEYTALEAEFQCSYSDMDAALEGVGAQYRDVISEYVEKLNDVDATIRNCIVESDKQGLIQACNSGISICKKFHDEMVSIPPEKFVAVKNLLPCFKVLARVASIALILGGKKALSKCKNQTVKDAIQWASTLSGWKAWVRDLLLAGKPGIRSLISNDAPVPGKFGESKLGKFARENAPKAAKGLAVLRSARSIATTIGESMERSRYAKMIREEDKDGKNTRQTKYNAVLGQIEEMTTMYQDLIKNADDIIASTNDPKAATEAYFSMLPDWTGAFEASGMDYDEWIAASEAEFLEEVRDWEPATELMANTYRGVVTQNQEILNVIMSNMWGAEDDCDKASADRYARQGIRSAERYIAEIKALEPTAFENIEPIIKFCMTVETFILAAEYRYFNAAALKNLIPDPLDVHDSVAECVRGMITRAAGSNVSSAEIDDMMAEAAHGIDILAMILNTLIGLPRKASRLILTGMNVHSFMKYYGSIFIGAYHTLLKGLALVKYKREGIDEGDEKLNLARKIAIGEALRFKSFCEQTLKIPQSEYDVERARMTAAMGQSSVESFLLDSLHTPIGYMPDSTPATEANVNWLFGD